MNKAQDLLDLKNRIEKARAEISEAEGALKQLRKQLKEKYDCKDEKEAKKKLVEIEKLLKEFADDLEKGIEKITTKYGVE